MQTTLPPLQVPPHPNIVELAVLLEDDRIKSDLRQSLERALRDELRQPTHSTRPAPIRALMNTLV